MAHAIRFAFSANCGMSVMFPGAKLLIDAFPKKKNIWSVVDSRMWAKLKTDADFMNPDMICYTHLDPDHYSYAYTLEAHKLWPDAVLALPGDDFSDSICLCEDHCELRAGSADIRFVKTSHTGNDEIDHYSIVMEADGKKVLVGGDVTIPTPEFVRFLEEENADILILPFPWCTGNEARRVLLEEIKPEHLVLVHIPFPAEDKYCYRHMVEVCIRKMSAVPDIRVFMEPFQRETFDLDN